MTTIEEYGLEIAKATAESVGKESANKLFEIIGGIFPFWGLKKKAVSTYISEIENSNLSPEVKMMAIANAKKTYQYMKNQVTIAQIAQDVALEGTNFTATSKVDDEWLERFIDSAKFVSDEQVQLLWGNILAKEFEQPSSTPPSVIRILSEITPRYARVFQVICNLAVYIVPVDTTGKIMPAQRHIILPVDYSYLAQYGINFSELNELQMLGLIQFDPSIGYVIQYNSELNPKLHLIYGEKTATVLQYKDRHFPSGAVMLTRAGKAIARFSETEIIEGHYDAVCNFLKKNKVELADTPEIKVV
ncbi:DUF2806 domain-containing protein [Candidatus Avoscillospira sp. LCP25S3_F1]|uniref:DUF2806 domain-containing protein n=1 Tax=Candidatus Avoscillospira sp. LCP25S3_F1 TaxID=3438825 RepID=UPI003F8DB855